MSIKSRARNVQKATDVPYQKALQTVVGFGAAPAKVCRKTGWTLQRADLFLLKTHAANELADLGLEPDDLTPEPHPGAVGEGFCPKRDDKTHCEHWQDGEACCDCGALPMTEDQKREQGMKGKRDA